MDNEKTCGGCEYFIGGGDFGLCCSLKYGLTYEYCKACDKFKKGVHWKRLAYLDSDDGTYILKE